MFKGMNKSALAVSTIVLTLAACATSPNDPRGNTKQGAAIGAAVGAAAGFFIGDCELDGLSTEW